MPPKLNKMLKSWTCCCGKQNPRSILNCQLCQLPPPEEYMEKLRNLNLLDSNGRSICWDERHRGYCTHKNCKYSHEDDELPGENILYSSSPEAQENGSSESVEPRRGPVIVNFDATSRFSRAMSGNRPNGSSGINTGRNTHQPDDDDEPISIALNSLGAEVKGMEIDIEPEIKPLLLYNPNNPNNPNSLDSPDSPDNPDDEGFEQAVLINLQNEADQGYNSPDNPNNPNNPRYNPECFSQYRFKDCLLRLIRIIRHY